MILRMCPFLPIAGARQTTQMRSCRSRRRKFPFEYERFRCSFRTEVVLIIGIRRSDCIANIEGDLDENIRWLV